MPVIPSFSSYAPVPRLAESYLGARRIEQAERENLRATELGWARVGQEAASDLQRAAIAREQIAANQVENEMRLKSQREMLERKLLQDQQEANIKNAYDQIRLGLDERKVKSDEAIAAMRLQEAADSFTAQQEYNRMVEAGVPPDAAFRRTGWGQSGFATALELGRQKASSVMTASEKNLRYRDLVRQEKAILDKYPKDPLRKPATEQEELRRIRRAIDDLLQPTGPVPVPGAPSPNSTMGAPPVAPGTNTPPFALGPPPVIPPGSNVIPQNPAFGMGPATNSPGPGLTIPSSLGGGTNRIKVVKITPAR